VPPGVDSLVVIDCVVSQSLMTWNDVWSAAPEQRPKAGRASAGSWYGGDSGSADRPR